MYTFFIIYKLFNVPFYVSHYFWGKVFTIFEFLPLYQFLWSFMLLLQGAIFVRLVVFVTAIFSIVQIGLFIIKNILHELQFIIFILMIVINIGIVHPQMYILSSFTLPQVVPSLYECLCSAEHKGRYSEECGK